MKKATKFLLGIFTFSMLISSIALAQNGIIGSGFGTTNFDWSNTDCFNSSANNSRILETTPGGTGNQYFRLVTCWDSNFNQWGPSSTVSDLQVTPETAVGSSEVVENSATKAYFINVASTSYKYVFKTREGGNPPGNPDFIVFEVQGTVRSVSSVSNNLSGNAQHDAEVTVTATLDGSFISGQSVYLRYTNDNYSTSTIVEMSGSGTSYTATIPGSTNQIGKTISYYVFTSGDGLSISSADSDFYTINLNNNGGSNYSYSVESSISISGDAGWRLLSLPKSGGTVADVSDDSPVQGVTGGDDAGSTANFIIYDNDATFEQPTNVSTAWGDGLGFGLYFYNNTTNGSSTLPVTLDASGAEPSSNVTVTLNPAASGYTLVGNPFASNYNTNSMTATSSNISNNIAFWNDGSSSYSTQDRTASSGYIISPWQGFWVQTVSAAATTLTIPTSGKTSTATTGTFFSKQVNNRGDLNFTLRSENTNDEAIRLAFRSDATTEFDADDFGKLTPLLSAYATMAFESNDMLKSVESLPYNLEEEITLSLQPQIVGVSGQFTFGWNGMETIPGEWELVLHDYDTGENIDMRAASEYVFTAGAQAKANPNPLSLLSGPAAVAMKAKAEANRFGITIRPTSVSNETEDSPAAFALEQNYPNPFNPSTTISYSVQEAGAVSISVYNLMGQKVATLVDETKAAGQYNVRWNAAGAASGMYYYRLEAGGQSITRKMTLIK